MGVAKDFDQSFNLGARQGLVGASQLGASHEVAILVGGLQVLHLLGNDLTIGARDEHHRVDGLVAGVLGGDVISDGVVAARKQCW